MKEWLQKKDPEYSWRVMNTKKEKKGLFFLLELTSQKWRSEKEVETPLWKHVLKVYIPEKLELQDVLLFVSGGVNNEPKVKEFTSCIIPWAQNSLSIVAELSLVPSQYLVFKDEKDERYQDVGRREDQLIAYSWDKYLKTEDKTWPLQLPMTKAVVRAFDCLQEFLNEIVHVKVEHFTVAGLSKRGWTSWLVAANDKRVRAVIPMVIDMLNLRESFAHHFNVYGKWAPSIKDYEEIGIEKWIFTDQFSNLLNLVEPYHYREQLKMPKYIINASGDEFFLPDSSHFYFDHLLEPKYLRYVPNCGHNLFESEDALQSAGAFYQMVSKQKKLPKFCWSQKHPHQIEIEFEDLPLEVHLWKASNLHKRDFRLCEVGAIWKKTQIKIEQTTCVIELSMPKKGYTAHFIEFKYPSLQKTPLIFTTDVYILSPEKGC